MCISFSRLSSFLLFSSLLNLLLGLVSLHAGSCQIGSQDGLGATARFKIPDGTAINQRTDTIYVCDGSSIRKITLQGINMSTHQLNIYSFCSCVFWSRNADILLFISKVRFPLWLDQRTKEMWMEREDQRGLNDFSVYVLMKSTNLFSFVIIWTTKSNVFRLKVITLSISFICPHFCFVHLC